MSISSLLCDPNPDDPLVPNIAHEYKTGTLTWLEYCTDSFAGTNTTVPHPSNDYYWRAEDGSNTIDTGHGGLNFRAVREVHLLDAVTGHYCNAPRQGYYRTTLSYCTLYSMFDLLAKFDYTLSIYVKSLALAVCCSFTVLHSSLFLTEFEYVFFTCLKPIVIVENASVIV